jgi:hypothetical protein
MTKGTKSGRPVKPSKAGVQAGVSADRGGNSKPLPSRVAKARALQRIQHDTLDVRSGSLIPTLRKQGYEEIPLDEIQDRMSKIRDPLAELIVTKRG